MAGTHKRKFLPDVESNKKGVKKTKSKFLCELRYTTSLPEPHNSLKMLRNPHPSNLLTRYCAAYVDLKRSRDIIPEPLLGVPIDLIDLDQYTRGSQGSMNPEDRFLVEDSKQKKKGGRDRKPTAWLRKQQLLDNNWYARTNRHVSKAEEEAARIRKAEMLREKRIQENSREGQIKKIVKSFMLAKEEKFKHPTKPNLKPVNVVELIPSGQLDEAKYTWVRMGINRKVNLDNGKSLLQCSTKDNQSLYEKDDSTDDFVWKRECNRRTAVLDKSSCYFMALTNSTADYFRFEKKLEVRSRPKNDALQDEMENRPETIRLVDPSTVNAGLTRVEDLVDNNGDIDGDED